MEHIPIATQHSEDGTRGRRAHAFLAEKRVVRHPNKETALHAALAPSTVNRDAALCDAGPSTAIKADAESRLTGADIEKMLHDIADLISRVCEDRTCPTRVNMLVAPDVNLVCNNSVLFRTIYGLALNAAHAMRAISGGQITIRVSKGCGKICFSLSHDGRALPDHDIRCLDLCSNSASQHDRYFKFGLEAATNLARAMSAKLRLLRSSKNGTEFSLILPQVPI